MDIKHIIGYIILFAIIASLVVAVIVQAIKEKWLTELAALTIAMALLLGLAYVGVWCCARTAKTIVIA